MDAQDRDGACAATVAYVTSGIPGYVNRWLPIARELRERGYATVTLTEHTGAAETVTFDGGHVMRLAPLSTEHEMVRRRGPVGAVMRRIPGVALGPRRTATAAWAADAASMLDDRDLADTLDRVRPALVLTEAEEHRTIRVVRRLGWPLALFEDLCSIRPGRDVPFPRSHHVPDGTWTSRVRAAARWQRFFAVEAARRRIEARWVHGHDWHSTLDELARRAAIDQAVVSRRYLQFYDYLDVPKVRTVAPELAFPGEPLSGVPLTQVTGPIVDGHRPVVGVDDGFAARWEAMRATGDRVVYVTLGTFLAGLGDLTERVIDAAAMVPRTQVVVSVGRDHAQWAGRALPANVAVFARVPQIEVLEHADLTVSTGGLNTGHESLWFGVPVLNIPAGGIDTAGNAARLAYHGVGRTLRPRDATTANLHTEIASMLDDDALVVRVAAMRDALRARDGVVSAADAIERLIAAAPQPRVR
jgi:zeaxanthin glucosyltransferase